MYVGIVCHKICVKIYNGNVCYNICVKIYDGRQNEDIKITQTINKFI